MYVTGLSSELMLISSFAKLFYHSNADGDADADADGDGERCYLRSEMEEVIAKWDELVKLEDNDSLAMYIGRRILRVQSMPAVCHS